MNKRTRVFCVLRRPCLFFNTRARNVRVWNRDFRSLGLVNSRRIRSPTENNKVTRDETSHFFRRMSLPVGGTEIRCEEETGPNAGFVTRVQIALVTI